MGEKTTALVRGGPVTALGLLWEAYSNFTTIRDLPDDAGGFAKMLADPPIYLPWLVVAIGIAVFAWFAFKGKWEPPKDLGVTQTSSGPNSPNSVQYGDVYNYHSPASAQRKPMKPAAGPSRDQRLTSRPPPKRPAVGDVEMREIFQRIVLRDGVTRSDIDKDYLRKASLEILDTIVAERLTVWGRVGDRAREVISQYDLSQSTLKVLNGVLFVPSGWEGINYTDLMLVSKEVDPIWKPESDEGDRECS